MDATYIIAIDPGAKGFITVMELVKQYPVECIPITVHTIKVNKKNRTVVDEDTLSKQLHLLVDKYKPIEIVIEKQRVQANEGVVSTGSTMQHFGWLKGFSEGKQLKKTIVSPKEWQSIYPDYIKDKKELDTKQKSKLYCSILYPDLDLKRTPRCKDASDGKTDSILIGVWRSQQLKLESLKVA